MPQEAVSTAETYPQLLLENQLCFPLYAAARRVINAYTPYLKPLGLTYTQYIVFLCLWEHGESTMGELCGRLRLDNGTLTPLIKKMEREGYVLRGRDPEDERVVRVRLTEQGWRMRETVQDIPARVSGCVRMQPADAKQLYDLLYKLMAEG